jgi:SAM-dependent methyltransferase
MDGDTFSRFSPLVENYFRFRPRYPHTLIDLLQTECGLSDAHIIADIGSGTGLLAELFLKNDNRVYGVEPNPDMRAAAERLMSAYTSFTSVAGMAEDTTLKDHSVHMVTAGQAFHWFDRALARTEFARILKPGGWVVLVWNLERSDGTPFSADFERFWQTYLNPETRFDKREPPTSILEFFGTDAIHAHTLDNHQVCDYDALRGRILSSSRAPQAHDPRHPAMLADLVALFEAHATDGSVTIHYNTEVIYGQLVA